MDAQMKKGLLEACVLVSLETGESYGYKIIEDIRNVVEISESTLYPILKRLESAQNLVVQSREFNGRLRKYYRITALGIERLAELRVVLCSMEKIHKFILGGRNGQENIFQGT